MSQHPGYSDRISHALGFTAKHLAEATRALVKRKAATPVAVS